MSLVAYSSSEEEDESDDENTATPPGKKRRLSSSIGNERKTSDLPPLPSSFLDQYSSTVRTSTQDDPSLHGGRKRVTPHVQGNWPTHVYLEWYPAQEESGLLNEVLSAAQPVSGDSNIRTTSNDTIGNIQRPSKSEHKIYSLLKKELDVPLPLHISLSRPLILKTDQKDAFLQQLSQQLNVDGGIKSFSVRPKDLVWHSNESDTRWFLVLRLESAATDTAVNAGGGTQQLEKLLARCNNVAREFGQPLLYSPKSKSNADLEANGDQFHISVGWSLHAPASITGKTGSVRRRSIGGSSGSDGDGVPYELLGRLYEMSISFTEVKVRIGQDVHRLPLKSRRRSSNVNGLKK